ncbi:hypothetical protein [Burkholderia pseudomallei]|uniref:hypothetical protein n=1 Tax=Burkholderia pseudomallei TaxID=28450 RepID=UPI000AE65491|nr:hypothetical protein [Burkholderia pseudomallei]
MKKPSSLAQQIAQAQRLLASWSESKRSSLKLEGTDVFLNNKNHREDRSSSSQMDKGNNK